VSRLVDHSVAQSEGEPEDDELADSPGCSGRATTPTNNNDYPYSKNDITTMTEAPTPQGRALTWSSAEAERSPCTSPDLEVEVDSPPARTAPPSPLLTPVKAPTKRSDAFSVQALLKPDSVPRSERIPSYGDLSVARSLFYPGLPSGLASGLVSQLPPNHPAYHGLAPPAFLPRQLGAAGGFYSGVAGAGSSTIGSLYWSINAVQAAIGSGGSPGASSPSNGPPGPPMFPGEF